MSRVGQCQTAATALLVGLGCAHGTPQQIIPRAPAIDAPVRDYRTTRNPVPVFVTASTPFNIIRPDSASPQFTATSLARRVGSGAVFVRSGTSRVRELIFYDSTGLVTSRVLDTALFTSPVTRLAGAQNGSLTLVTFGGRWKTFDREHHAVSADSMIRLGVSGGDWIGRLSDGSSVVRTYDRTSAQSPTPVTVARGASFIRIDPIGTPQYLPIVGRDLTVVFLMPISLSAQVTSQPNGTTMTMPAGAVSPPTIASWPVRPTSTALASDSTIWDFDVMAWRLAVYDARGIARAAVLPPVPPANDSARLDHPVLLSESMTLQTLLDDEGRLWMEPFDSQTLAFPRPTLRQQQPMRATASPLWGFGPDGSLLGTIDVPRGMRVLQIGSDFLFGLEERDGKIIAVTYGLRKK